ncbi:MAG: VCBS repeat-containing protein [Deltaproteobacteria bacterium]|nr:VCBS repeat-containing protein [Deltaproteobacteria bacterium]
MYLFNRLGPAVAFVGLLASSCTDSESSRPERVMESSSVGPADFDRDGVSELVVAAPGAPGATDRGGRVYVYAAPLAGASMPTPALTLSGIELRDARFGEALTVGDFDRDGYPDLAVGGFSERRVHVFRGSEAGLTPTPAQTLLGSTEGCFHAAVAVGDVDGDGYGDLAVGDSCADLGVGRVYLFVGSSDGLVPRAAAELSGALEPWMGPLGQVRAAGDTDRDGYSDVWIGNSFELRLHRGGPDGLSTEPSIRIQRSDSPSLAFPDVTTGIDTNGDGLTELVLRHEARDPDTGVRYELRLYPGTDAGPSTTPVVLAARDETCDLVPTPTRAAGDFDADGYDDLVVRSCNGLDVWGGSAHGPVIEPSPRIVAPPWIPHDGYASAEDFGWAASALDLDGDGYDDLVVGAPSGAGYYGRAFVYRGGPSGLATEPDLELRAPDGRESFFGHAFPD